MTRAIISLAAVLAVAGSASAYVSGSNDATGNKDISPIKVLPDVRGVTGAVVNFNFLGDVDSVDPVGDPLNVVGFLDLASALGFPAGTPLSMTAVGWDVTITAETTSWLSEARMYFDDQIAPDLSGLFLAPGAGNNAPGTGAFSSGGLIDLSDAGIPNIFLPDGVLRLEFFESFDDINDFRDGFWHAGGTISIGVDIPTPGALALCGVAGLAGLRRRR